MALALLLAVLLLAGATPAGAYADLIGADPAPGSTVAGSPAVIRLSFSQPLLSASRVSLTTGQFQPVAGVTTQVAGSELRALLAHPLAPATYTVQWIAVSDDGNSTQGSYQFAVAPANTPIAGRLAPLMAAIAIVLGGGMALWAWLANQRRRM